MKLVSFTVERYRSITTARKIEVSDLTILIGPNNEGKSNILRALVTAMHILTKGKRYRSGRGISSRLAYEQAVYDWARDFPVNLRSKHPDGKSVIILEFLLNEDEVAEFRRDIGSSLNGSLPLRIEVGNADAKVTVAKQGPGGVSLTEKSGRISEFLAKRIDIQHIPAVRTASSAQAVVDAMVEMELRTLEDVPEYKTALDRIAALQQPILDQLSSSIKQTLTSLLPRIRDVRIEVNPYRGFVPTRRICEVTIDDGVPTSLERKGDGVQSLATLGIMRHASERNASARNLVIAIEEPESHLHPDAIHELRNVLRALAEKYQVVLATHCPLFVNRGRLASNVIVKGRLARPAKSVQEIRDLLGVRASDNLRHAEVVLLVEGETDRVALDALLKHSSSKLATALGNSHLAIDWLGGGTNLGYKASLVTMALCKVHCFLDDDSCGRDAYGKAEKDGILTSRDVNFTILPGREESELEDLYNQSLYAALMEKHCGFAVTSSREFKSPKKWSDRISNACQKEGKPWSSASEKALKIAIAQEVARSPATALHPCLRAPFDALVRALEDLLQ